MIPTSPGVYTQETDLTGSVPAVGTSVGAFVGTFNWGPVLEPTTVTNGTDLRTQFGTPDSNTATSFFTAWNFLQYSNNIKIVRSLGSGANNATANAAANATYGTVILNDTDYFNNVYSNIYTFSFAARSPAAIGNSLQVYVFANTSGWSAASANAADPLYTFANQFSYAPNTSPYVTNVTNGTVSGDEMHILVVDSMGLITGTANTVLEKFQSLSRLKDSMTPDGVSNYYREYIYQNSKYIFVTGQPTPNTTGWDITISAATAIGDLEGYSDARANVAVFQGGSDGTVTAANTVTGMAQFQSKTAQSIDLWMVGPGGQVETNQAIAYAESRKDCIVLASPPLANVTNPDGPATAIINYAGGLTRSSYAVLDSGWKYQFDQYNNVYRWVPLNGDVAGLCARTDSTNDPWWSPAGLRRGQILNSVKLAYNPDEADQSTLYQAGIDPVVTFPGEGTMLYGDKTFLNYSSAFNRINVRRLFIVLEKSISKAARSSLFEFNDATTQAAFVNLVSPFLRQVKGRRGITSYQVTCDSTNNTPAVVNAHQFVGTIYVVPAQSINYIMLNFVAVNQGVNFSYKVGQV
jgi:phage tail sheath protein FI